MNKLAVLGVSALLAISLAACGAGNNAAQTAATETQSLETNNHEESGIETSALAADSSESEDTKDGSNILIAYFSRVGNTDFGSDVDATSSASIQLKNGGIAGNTELIAGMIQENAGGDLFLIETTEKYPAEYDEVLDVAQGEQGEAARPELASHVENMENYDVVFLGYPNWWGDCPMAVYSFLQEYDFSGKTVIPFCTSGGSGLSGTVSSIKGILGDATVLDGFAAGDSEVTTVQAAVETWVAGLGITE